MTWKAINFWLSLISDAVEIVPILIIVFLCYKKSFLSHQRSSTYILAFFFLASFCVKMMSDIRFLKAENNLIYYSLLGVVEIVLLAIFYLKELNAHQRWLWSLVGILLVFNCISIYFQAPEVFNSIQWSVNSFTLMVLALLLFYKYYQQADLYSTHTSMIDATFIANIGLLLYFSGSFFVYMMAWYVLAIEQPVNFYQNGWIIVSVVTIIRAIFISIYFWKIGDEVGSTSAYYKASPLR